MVSSKEIKRFDESTLDDAMSVVREAFSEKSCAITKKILRNPIRKICPDSGSIGYRNGQPVAFQAAMLRRLYLRDQEIFAIVGGQTSKLKKKCPFSLLLETIAEAEKARNSSLIGFGNTSCVQSGGIAIANGSHVGPISASMERWGVVNLVRCALYVIRRKVLRLPVHKCGKYLLDGCRDNDWETRSGDIVARRIYNIETSFFDCLMDRYVKVNKGIASSRRADEVEWMFGERIYDGRALVVGAFDTDGPIGYVVVSRADETGMVWKLLDMVAVENDKQVMRFLLKSARNYLCKWTPAIKWTVTQFPDWVQPMLKQIFPFAKNLGFNRITWTSSDAQIEAALRNEKDCWYFCPYDGDLAFF